MEMQAAIEALKYLKGTSEIIELYTDSKYLDILLLNGSLIGNQTIGEQHPKTCS